ncbi:MAG: FAD-binding oxidoreductase, partial [Desulfobacteraceae bacterium]|nr:FAD-binding oxidoreductase [Desulfobacteraceae bacterium]
MPKPSILPAWLEQPPLAGSRRAIFKWGAPDRWYHPKPGFIRYLNARLGLDSADWGALRDIGAEKVELSSSEILEASHLQALTAIVGPENAQADDFSRVRYACGQSAEEILLLRSGNPPAASGLVLHPRNSDDVRAIVHY